MTAPLLVVFDIAGTTLEDPGAVNLCLREALATQDVSASVPRVDTVMGLPKPEAIRLLLNDVGRAEDEALLAVIHEDFLRRMSRYYAEDPGVRAVPGIEEIWTELKRGDIGIALDTGFSRDIVNLVMRRLGWDRSSLIDASVTSDEVERGRPYPDMIFHLMKRLGVEDASRVAKLGDAPADLLEGQNAGCGRVIGVTWGSHTRAQLATHPHTAIVDRVEDLLPALGLGLTR
jgi:phosphonatase-like hydrolase